MRQLLWWILAGTRGGPTRAQIILTLKEQPMNSQQLANALQVDYKTVRYHLDLLVSNQLLVSGEKRYGNMYFLLPELEANFPAFLEIWGKLGKKNKMAKDEPSRLRS